MLYNSFYVYLIFISNTKRIPKVYMNVIEDMYEKVNTSNLCGKTEDFMLRVGVNQSLL